MTTFVKMLRLAGLLLLAWTTAVQAHEPKPHGLPVPKALERPIAFWTRIFAAIDGQGGVLHDADDLGVVYHTFARLPETPVRPERPLRKNASALSSFCRRSPTTTPRRATRMKSACLPCSPRRPPRSACAKRRKISGFSAVCAISLLEGSNAQDSICRLFAACLNRRGCPRL